MQSWYYLQNKIVFIYLFNLSLTLPVVAGSRSTFNPSYGKRGHYPLVVLQDHCLIQASTKNVGTQADLYMDMSYFKVH